MKIIVKFTKIFIAIVLATGFDASLFAQTQKLNLGDIKTVKDAQRYYSSCSSMLYKDNLGSDDLKEMLQKLYDLGQWLGIRSIDHNDISEYDCRVAAPYDDDKHELESIRFRIVYLYKSLQQILWPYGKPLSNIYWFNFESQYMPYVLKIAEFGEMKHEIISFEYDLNGIRFVIFKNKDENFAYDLKITCLIGKKQKTEMELTLMPNEVKVISSTIAPGNQPYAIPQKYEISNKYYIGKQ